MRTGFPSRRYPDFSRLHPSQPFTSQGTNAPGTVPQSIPAPGSCRCAGTARRCPGFCAAPSPGRSPYSADCSSCLLKEEGGGGRGAASGCSRPSSPRHVSPPAAPRLTHAVPDDQWNGGHSAARTQTQTQPQQRRHRQPERRHLGCHMTHARHAESERLQITTQCLPPAARGGPTIAPRPPAPPHKAPRGAATLSSPPPSWR